MKQVLWLVKNGISFDVACSLEDSDRVAWSIMFSEFEGRKFNFDAWKFEEK